LPRRLRLLLLLTVLLLLLGFVVDRLPSWSARFLAERLTSFFHRTSTVGAVRYHLLPPEVEILDLRVGGFTPQAAPFLEIPRVRVNPSLGPLWGGELVLSRVRVERLTARINAFPQGGDDIPKMGGGRGGGPALRVGRLIIERSEFILNHERIPLDMDLPNFRGRLLSGPGRPLAGRISFGPGRLQFGSAPLLPFATDLNLRVEGALITVESARMDAYGLELAYQGRIRMAARPQGQFTIGGAVDLDALDRHVMRTGLGIKGAAHWDGLISVDGSKLRIEGKVEGTQGAFDGVPVPRFAGEVAWDGDGLHVKGMDIDALGGSATLDIEVPSSARPDRTVRIVGPLRGTDAEGLVRFIFDWGAFGVGAAATGDVDVSWPKGRARAISGRFALDLAPQGDGRTPLSGRVEWSAEDGEQRLERADLTTPHTHALLRGRIARDDRTELGLDAESTDLGATDDLLLRLRRALGNPEAQRAELSGSGVFRGHWRGTLDVPVFEGRFSGRDVGYLGVVWGHAEWAGTMDPFVIASHSLVLRRSGSELWLDGRTATGFYGQEDALDVRARVKEWPAADLTKALRFDLDLTGAVSGEAAYTGRRSALVGSARLAVPAGRYYGIAFDDLEVRTRSRGGSTEITAGRARLGGGEVAFRGTVSDEGFYDGSAEADGVDVGAVLPALPGEARAGGRVSGRATLQGTLVRPRLTASLRSARIFVGDEGLGALEARVSGRGDGRVRIEAECRSPRVDLALAGDVQAAPPYAAALTLEARETSLDPYLRASFPALPSVVGIVATGRVELGGPLTDAGRLRAAATASEVRIQLPDYPVHSREPVRLDLADGRIDLHALHLAGEGTDLVVSGSAGLGGDDPLAVTARGAADLRALQVVAPGLRGRGAARLAIDVSGTKASPQVEGTLSLDGGGIRVRGFPQGLEDVRGTVRFSESAAEFSGVSASFGGGTVDLEGQAAYAGGRLGSFDVRATGRNLGLRYPQGLRSAIDADLRLFGDAGSQWVAGAVDVRQAFWTRRYDLASELLAAGAAAEPALGLGESVHFDLRLRAPGTFRIDNNLATLQARADLVVQGTGAAPVVVGRAEVERGRVYFQGQTYVIRRGTMEFANPQKIDPFFDIEAEASIRSYRVTLRVAGTLERITPTLTSDPPLSALQILNLMAGREEVTSLAQVQTQQTQLAATGAATLAAGRIAEEIGLEREAERIFGLNRFSIDPSLVKGSATTPVARVTVGKRITPDLNALYAQDLSGTSQDRVVSVEYTLSDRFSLRLTWSDLDGFGGDILLRQSR
jgi:hypothetical protein